MILLLPTPWVLSRAVFSLDAEYHRSGLPYMPGGWGLIGGRLSESPGFRTVRLLEWLIAPIAPHSLRWCFVLDWPQNPRFFRNAVLWTRLIASPYCVASRTWAMAKSWKWGAPETRFLKAKGFFRIVCELNFIIADSSRWFWHTVACKRIGVFRNFRVQAKKSKNNFIKRWKCLSSSIRKLWCL